MTNVSIWKMLNVQICTLKQIHHFTFEGVASLNVFWFPKAPGKNWLAQGNRNLLLQFRRLEIHKWVAGSVRTGSEPLSKVCRQLLPVSLHIVFPPRASDSVFKFLLLYGHLSYWIRAHSNDLMLTNCIYNDLISKQDHSLRDQELRFQQ